MDFERVNEALIKIEPGLYKYLYIMERFHKTDVSKDLEFQKRFNGFYRIRQRKPEFYNEYYNFMEEHKDNEVSFDLVLEHFYNTFERVEASFSSKLVATINPNLPVWDEFILKNLGLKKPAYGTKNRINKTIELYNSIIKWYEDFLQTDDSRRMIQLFDERYKGVDITDTKKIDLILWQIR
jgi:hypothetical protein